MVLSQSQRSLSLLRSSLIARLPLPPLAETSSLSMMDLMVPKASVDSSASMDVLLEELAVRLDVDLAVQPVVELVVDLASKALPESGLRPMTGPSTQLQILPMTLMSTP